MDEPLKRTTLSESAYQSLRRKIMAGTYLPGAKLLVASIAAELSVSATPVNEALMALEREGLVVCEPHRGYFVASVTTEDVSNVYDVREAFELLMVRAVSRSPDQTLISRLTAILEQARGALARKDTAAFGELDMAFHRAIWAGANNPLAMRIGELVEAQMSLLVATTARAPGRFRGAYEEHREILKSLKEGNATAAATAMRKHIRNAKAALTSTAKRIPDRVNVTRSDSPKLIGTAKRR